MDDGERNGTIHCASSNSKAKPLLLSPDEIVRINVCGTIYQPMKSTLSQFPTTLLGNDDRLFYYYVEFMDAYYFDRHRECFEAILYYFQSGGSLIRPTNIPMDLFAQEVRFFGISEEVLSNLQTMEGYVPYHDEVARVLPTNKWQRKVWRLMEYPDSSLLARIIGMLSIFVIIVSICTFCLETTPKYRNITETLEAQKQARNRTSGDQDLDGNIPFVMAVKYIEIISVAWFTVEYVVRFLSSPNKWIFFKSFLNLIDLAAILPYFLIQAIQSKEGSPLAVIRVARLLRVFRVFKLSRHSMGLQVLGNTLKASINELAMIVFLLCFSIIIFSSAIYYAEHDSEKQTTFESIPSTFWYALVTITTVGYGDHVPLSLPGKLIGGLCAVAGVLTVAMVVPVIVTNFEFFYKRDRINAAQKEQRRLSVSMRKNSDASNLHVDQTELELMNSDDAFKK